MMRTERSLGSLMPSAMVMVMVARKVSGIEVLGHHAADLDAGQADVAADRQARGVVELGGQDW